MTTGRRQFLVATITAVILCIPLGHGFERVGPAMDEGALLLYPEMILKGALPYRDFETFYGPGNLSVLSAAYAIFGVDIFVERAVGLIYRLLVVIGLFCIVRQWGTIVAAGSMGLAGSLFLWTNIGAYAWVGAWACVLWSLWLTATSVGWRHLVGGIVAGIALFYRPDLAPALIAGALPLFLWLDRPGRWKYVAGALLGLLPLAALTLWIGPGEIFNNLFLFPVLRSNPARQLPLLSADTAVILLLAAHVIASLVNVWAGALAVRTDKRDVKARLLLGAALFGLILTQQAIQRIDDGHVVAPALVSLGLLPLSILVIARRRAEALGDGARQWIAVLASIVAVQTVLPEHTIFFRQEFLAGLGFTPNGGVFVEGGGRSFPVGSQETAAATDTLLKNLDKLSLPGQRLFVGPADLRRTNYNDTFLYHLAPKLRPATYFLEMNPLSANRPDSRLAGDVRSADWLVLNRAWDSWSEPNRSVEFGSDAPNRVVSEYFEVVGQSGTYVLLRRKP